MYNNFKKTKNVFATIFYSDRSLDRHSFQYLFSKVLVYIKRCVKLYYNFLFTKEIQIRDYVTKVMEDQRF